MRSVLAIIFVTACGHGPQPRSATCGAAFSSLSPPNLERVAIDRKPFGWVTSVRVVGVEPDVARVLEQDLTTKVGMVLADTPVSDDVRRLFKSGIVSDAHVELGDDGGIRFVVTPRATIARVEVRGGDPKMARRFQLLAGSAFEPTRLFRMAAAAELAYVREGRLDASVTAHTVAAPGRVDVCIAANPGPKVTIAEWRFPGPTVIPEPTIIAAMRSGPKVNRVGGLYDADSWTVDALYVQELFWDRGYAQVQVGSPRTKRVGDRMFVEVPITPGSRFRFGQISISPRFVFDMPLRRGQVFSRAELVSARAAIQKLPGVKAVVPQTKIDDATDRIDVVFEVEMK